MSQDVDCIIDGENCFGEYVNSFRVLFDGVDILLDFCLYSESLGTAKLVSRLRVTKDFLSILLDRVVEVIDDTTLGKIYTLGG